jgi:hypothetical protein
MRKTTGSVTLSDGDKARLRAMVDAHGEADVRRRLQLGRTSLERALAGLGIRRGTAALIRAGLNVAA